MFQHGDDDAVAAWLLEDPGQVKDALVLIFMLLFFGGLYALMSLTPEAGDGGQRRAGDRSGRPSG